MCSFFRWWRAEADLELLVGRDEKFAFEISCLTVIALGLDCGVLEAWVGLPHPTIEGSRQVGPHVHGRAH